MTINAAMTLLVAELEVGEVPDPLTQSFTLATVWADLARLAGEPLPAAVAAVVGDTLDRAIDPLPLPHAGGYTDYVRELLPAD